MTAVTLRRSVERLFGPARDQAARPTCMAFALSDLHAALRDSWTPLSCEFAFFHAQRRAGRPPNVGATLPAMLDAIRYDGQPCENGWPYLAAIPPDPTAWRPPEEVGEIFRRDGNDGRATTDAITIAIDGGAPVLVLLYLSVSFDCPGQDGLVDSAADEQPDPARRHAVVAVGHGICDNQRAVLIRNSWGADWGRSGYAWLTESFLEARMIRIATLLEYPGVSLPSTAT